MAIGLQVQALGLLSFSRSWKKTRIPMFAVGNTKVIQSWGCLEPNKFLQ